MNKSRADERETKRLLLAMASSARLRPDTIGGAIAAWEKANTGKDAGTYLRADGHQMAKVSITPLPVGSGMPKQAMALATDLAIDGFALVNLLRFVASARAMTESKNDGERLLAALDHDIDDGIDGETP